MTASMLMNNMMKKGTANYLFCCLCDADPVRRRSMGEGSQIIVGLVDR